MAAGGLARATSEGVAAGTGAHIVSLNRGRGGVGGRSADGLSRHESPSSLARIRRVGERGEFLGRQAESRCVDGAPHPKSAKDARTSRDPADVLDGSAASYFSRTLEMRVYRVVCAEDVVVDHVRGGTFRKLDPEEYGRIFE